jgi:hypothetical protein
MFFSVVALTTTAGHDRDFISNASQIDIPGDFLELAGSVHLDGSGILIVNSRSYRYRHD